MCNMDGDSSVMRNPAFSTLDARSCANGGITLPDMPPLYAVPGPYHPTSNGGPPLEPRKRGRPSIDTPELRDRIIDLLSDGVPMRAICRAEGMPDRKTVLLWRRADPLFARLVEFAAEEGRIHLVQVVSEQREEVIRTCTPKVARRWWNVRRQQLLRLNPRFFGGGPR
jgi:hypothetical protein